jgi:hypothetical protein
MSTFASVLLALIVFFVVIPLGSCVACIVCAQVSVDNARARNAKATTTPGSSPGFTEPQPAESAEVPPVPEAWDGRPMSLLYAEKRCQESAANVLPAGATLPDLMDQSVLLGAKPSRGKTAARWASYYIAADGHKARYSCVIEVNHAPAITLD